MSDTKKPDSSTEETKPRTGEGTGTGSSQGPLNVHIHTTGGGDPAPQKAPEEGGENWKDRFAGLQQTHASAKQEWEKQQADLQAKIEELQGQVEGFGEIQGQLTEAQEKYQQELVSAALAAAELQKVQLLAEKDPGLIAFREFVPHVSEDGTILDAEQLQAKVEAFYEKFDGTLQARLKGAQIGTVPDVPGSNTRPGENMTTEQLSSEIERLAGSKDPKEREKARTFTALLREKQKRS